MEHYGQEVEANPALRKLAEEGGAITLLYSADDLFTTTPPNQAGNWEELR